MHFDAKELRQGGEARTLPFSPQSFQNTQSHQTWTPLSESMSITRSCEASKPGIPSELQVCPTVFSWFRPSKDGLKYTLTLFASYSL